MASDKAKAMRLPHCVRQKVATVAVRMGEQCAAEFEQE